MNALRFLGSTLSATNSSGIDSHVNGAPTQTGGTANINELEIGRTLGTTGSYAISGGALVIARSITNNSLYFDGNRNTTDSGAGTFQISGGSLITRSGVKLGDATKAGTGTFAVMGAAASQIGIGTQADGTWIQNAGSTLKVGIDTAGVTKIFIDDTLDVTGTSATTAQVTALGLGPSWKWRTAPSRKTASPLLRAWTRLSDPSASSPREPMRN